MKTTPAAVAPATVMPAVHVHVESESADCDGHVSRTYAPVPRPDETPAEFEARIIETYGEVIEGISTREDWTREGAYGFTYNEVTEEGYIYREVEFCTSHCSRGPATYRDHRAEAMGY